MKKALLLAGVACFSAAHASAFEFNPYVAAKAKYAFVRNEVKVTGTFEGKLNKDVWGGSIASGIIYPLLEGDFRFEVEYTKNADAKKGDAKIKTQGVLFNVYYDFEMPSGFPVIPYVGAGLGWGRAELESAAKSIKDDGVSMQIGTGVSCKVNEYVAFDLGYRYVTYGDFEKEYRIPGILYEKYEYKPRAHEILLGVRYEF